MGTDHQLRARIASLLHDQLGTDLKLLLDDVAFVDLDYDSLTFVEIKMMIENDLRIPSQRWDTDRIPVNLTQLTQCVAAGV